MTENAGDRHRTGRGNDGGDSGGHDEGGHDEGGHDEGGHGHGHQHGAALLRGGARHVRPLTIAFVLTAGFLVAEVAAGIALGSLALLSDAGHMFTDVLGLGMALAAIRVATAQAGRRHSHHTFGLFRLEILAAFVNSLLLGAVAIYVLIEAVLRLRGDATVPDQRMIYVAIGGLLVNVAAFGLLRAGAAESMNIEGAYLEVLADLVGSVGVIIGAVVISLTDWAWVDPAIAIAIGVWILPRTMRLGNRAVHVLLQAAPPHIDLERLRGELAAIPSVVDVHDLHVWTLTSGMEAASAHLMTTDAADAHGVLDQARSVLAGGYGIDHSTFQIEPASHTGCAEVDW
jgi:cobalt-zinc-cadmium efflux system protein